MNTQNLSANKIWKQSSTNLSFKDWLNREKLKGNYIPNQTINEILTEQLRSDLLKDSSKKELEQKKISKTIYGIDQRVIIFSGILIAGAITYSYFRK